MHKIIAAALLTSTGLIERVDQEINSPTHDEVELQVGYVGICGSDIEVFDKNSRGTRLPVILGHEFSAKILNLGSDVCNFSEGQWVTVAPILTCGNCEYCKTGREYFCHQRVIFGNQVDGALRERLIMPCSTLFPVPDSITPMQAALVEPLAVAVHAVNRVKDFIYGANIVISGAGAIGLLIAQILQFEGANEIILLDINEDRLKLAENLGFEAHKPTETGFSFAQIHFIVTGSPDAIIHTPNLLSYQGTTVLVGILENTAINWTDLLLKEATITTSRYFTMEEFKRAVTLISNGSVRVSPLIEDVVGFYDIFTDGGKTVMERAKKAVRLIIEF